MYDSLIAASRQSEKKGNIEHVHEIEKPIFLRIFRKWTLNHCVPKLYRKIPAQHRQPRDHIAIKTVYVFDRILPRHANCQCTESP